MSKKDWHTKPASTVMAGVSSGKDGISGSEARKRLESVGLNEIAVQSATSPVKIFLSQFKDLMVIILIIATLISLALEEYIDSIVILIILILNAIIGFVQEYKAERAILALQALTAPSARVIRDGKEMIVPSRELVPGDLIVLQTGDMVPADCRLVEAVNLKVNESALTGESKAVKKDADMICDKQAFLGDRNNMVFSSTMVEYGRGKAVVVATGMQTEIGHIAEMIRKVQFEPTPLQQKLHKLGKQIGAAILGLCALVFFVEFIRSGGENVFHILLVAVSLAVAAIPEGLPAVVTISLAIGLQRMLKKNALIRRLPAVETLGSTTVICSDKTGTLTKGVMNIRLIKTLDRVYDVTGEGYEPTGHFIVDGTRMTPSEDVTLETLLTAGALCNDSRLEEEDGQWIVRGDSTEGAFVVAAGKAELVVDDLFEMMPRYAENPFDSERKRMSTVHRDGSGGCVVYAKGAIDSILPCCTRKMVNGSAQPLEDADTARIEEMNADMANHAYRVLALAYKDSECQIDTRDAESNLVFLGLVGMIDAPRKEAIEGIQECKKAGIRVVMITGDHKLTAMAIAKQMDIASDGSLVLTGVELDSMSDDQLFEVVEKVMVYARVSPEHKMRIVSAWQRHGQIVAMTGDGVNDAPALKKADVGIAMGITGTDVSKEAAEMVLTDDNFASIVGAVKEGRRCFDNIRKFIKYTLTSNSGEIWVMLSGPFLGMGLVLLPLQILWINLVTDGLPGLALAFEPSEKDTMRRPPYHPQENIIGRRMKWHIIWVGLLMGMISLGIGFWVWRAEADPAANTMWQTMIFTTLTLSQMGHVMAIRSGRESLFTVGVFSNMKLIAAVSLTFILQLMVIYAPFMQAIFKTVSLPLDVLVFCLVLSTVVFWGVELEKWVLRRREERATA